ncbi:MAG: phage tail tape measure protein, partial [Nanoarchaeota archaeon]
MPLPNSFEAGLKLIVTNGPQVQAQVQRFVSNPKVDLSRLKADLNRVNAPLGRITGNFNDFNKSLDASTARIAAFGVSTALIFGAQRAFTALAKSAIEVEKSLTDINVIFNLSDKNIKKFGDDLFKVAKDTGTSFQTVSKAALEFSRQGLGVAETLKRTRDALILSRLSALEANDAVGALTATVNSFSKEALTTTDVLNKLVAVDAKFAVSAGDLVEALRRVGSTATDAGVGLDELIAIVTAVQERTFRGGAVIGNAFKTIFTRIQRPETIKQIEELGIAVRDLEGNVAPATQILISLAQSYDTLSKSQRQQIDELTAGIFQMNVLKAAIQDLSKPLSKFDKALETSKNATNEAFTRIAQLNLTLRDQLNRTVQAITQAGAKVGEFTFRPVLENLFGAGTGIAEFINNLFKDEEGEETGKRFGQRLGEGVLKGLGNVIAGPGLVLALAVITKLAFKTFKEIGQAALSILQIGSATETRRNLEQQILVILGLENTELKHLISGKLTDQQLAANILTIEQGINATLDARIVKARAAAAILYGQGARSRSTFGFDVVAGKRVKNKAGGDAEVFNAIVREQGAVNRGVGGANQAARPVVTSLNMGRGRTKAVVNSDEKIIRNFANTGQDAVFNRSMISSVGGVSSLGRFGRVENLPRGFVPNNPNLQKFLRGSKVKGVLYHGTQRAGFSEFYEGSHFGSRDQAQDVLWSKGIERTRIKQGAIKSLEDSYALGERDAIYPVYLSIKKPKRVRDVGHAFNWDNEIDLAKSQGYDGIVYRNTEEARWRKNHDSYIAFYPNQIKSAIGNRGTYNPNDPDITKSLGLLPSLSKRKISNYALSNIKYNQRAEKAFLKHYKQRPETSVKNFERKIKELFLSGKIDKNTIESAKSGGFYSTYSPLSYRVKKEIGFEMQDYLEDKRFTKAYNKQLALYPNKFYPFQGENIANGLFPSLSKGKIPNLVPGAVSGIIPNLVEGSLTTNLTIAAVERRENIIEENNKFKNQITQLQKDKQFYIKIGKPQPSIDNEIRQLRNKIRQNNRQFNAPLPTKGVLPFTQPVPSQQLLTTGGRPTSFNLPGPTGKFDPQLRKFIVQERERRQEQLRQISIARSDEIALAAQQAQSSRGRFGGALPPPGETELRRGRAALNTPTSSLEALRIARQKIGQRTKGFGQRFRGPVLGSRQQLTAGIAGPSISFLAPFLGEVLGLEEKNQRALGQAGAGIGIGGLIASIANNPVGVGAGAGIAIGSTLGAGVNALLPSFEHLTKRAEELASKFALQSEASAKFLVAQEELEDLIRSDAKQSIINKGKQKLTQAAIELGPQAVARLSGRSLKEQREIVDEVNEENQQQLAREQGIALLTQFGPGSFNRFVQKHQNQLNFAEPGIDFLINRFPEGGLKDKLQEFNRFRKRKAEEIVPTTGFFSGSDIGKERAELVAGFFRKSKTTAEGFENILEQLKFALDPEDFREIAKQLQKANIDIGNETEKLTKNFNELNKEIHTVISQLTF